MTSHPDLDRTSCTATPHGRWRLDFTGRGARAAAHGGVVTTYREMVLAGITAVGAEPAVAVRGAWGEES